MKKKITKIIKNILINKKKYREINVIEKNDLFIATDTENITLDDPTQIEILTRANNTAITEQKGK